MSEAFDLEKTTFTYFDKIIHRYKETNDSELELNKISIKYLSQIIHNELLKKIINTIEQNYNEKTTLKNLNNLLKKFHKKLRATKTNNPPLKRSLPPNGNGNASLGNQGGGLPVILPKVITPNDPRVLKLLEKAPVEEQFLFLPVIMDFVNDPSPQKLNQINRALDRYETKAGIYDKVDLPGYKRPDWLAPKQNYIADEVQLPKNTFVHGERQTGKDSAIAVGKLEKLILSKQDHPLYFMASNQQTARSIMKKILAEDRFSYITPFIKDQFTDLITFHTIDGHVNRIVIISTTEAAVKGITGDLWVDDIDTIIKDKKEKVITKAIAITRSNPEINFCMTSNMGKGSYITLLEEWQKDKWKNNITIYELKVGDVSHIIAEKDEFLFATMVALAGEGEARAQLLNEYDSSGEIFNKDSLQTAFDTYEFFMSQLSDNIAPEGTILSIDPSITGHPFGWIILRYGDGMIWELDGGELHMGELDAKGHLITVTYIIEFLSMKARSYYCQKIICEENSTGGALRVGFQAKRHRVAISRFGGEKTEYSHSHKIEILNDFLNNNAFVFKNRALLEELRIYNPWIDKEEHKGDIADATLHCVWELVGGLRYLKKKYRDAAQKLISANNDPHEDSGDDDGGWIG